MTKTYDVMILGCGPTGATLANLLAAQGHSVAVFEKEKEIFHAPRAMMLDAESCRIFQSMGIMQKLKKRDSKPFYLHRFVNHKRKTLIDFNFEGIEETYGHPAIGTYFHQPSLERFLRADFLTHETRVEAFFNHEVIELEESTNGVCLIANDLSSNETIRFNGRYLVGADGGNSLTRRHIGSERVDLNYSRQWVVMDMIVHDPAVWNAIREGAEFKCDANAAVVFVKGHHGHIRLDCEKSEEKAQSFGETEARHLANQYFDAESAEFIRIAPYHFYAGMPKKWRAGRLLIAGDAAHQTSPFAGQGLNMGLRDAANLAFKFDLIFKGNADDGLLDSYALERWQNCKSIILAATANGRVLSVSSKWAIAKRSLRFLLARILQFIGVNIVSKGTSYPGYRQGLIGTSAWAGERLPQPFVHIDGQNILLDAAIGNGFCLLLRNIETSPDIDAFKQRLNGRVLVVGKDFKESGTVLSSFMGKAHALLARPDRYVFDGGDSGKILCQALFHALATNRFQTEEH